MPTDLIDFLPVFVETVDTVRARLDADANAGVDPSDPSWLDTTPGGWWYDATQVVALELARLYGFLAVEIVAAMNPGTAWGIYLDYFGETFNVPRNDEVQATGTVLFTGTAGTLIPAGTEVATVVADPSTGDVPERFTTDVSVTLGVAPGPGSLAGGVAAAGALTAGTFYYVVTAITPTGETIASSEVSFVSPGGVSEVNLSWSAVAGATGYNIYRGTSSGAETLLHTQGATTTFVDDGSYTAGAQVPPTNTAAVTAENAGTEGNVSSGAISQVLSPIADTLTVTNVAATSGGADVESDARYQARMLAAIQKANGAGNVADYQSWVLEEFPQVGFVTVEPLWSGAGTVRVIITDTSNDPLSASVVAAVQAFLDPIAGQGAGKAPIGAVVTVTTPTATTVTVVATIVPVAGYSLDGTSGTIALRAAIQASVGNYINGLSPNKNVILAKVIAQIALVPGVADVSGVTLNGVAANLTIASNHVASTSAATITLS